MNLETPSLFRRCATWTKRLAKWLFFVFALYALILAVGLIPINNDFQPAQDGVEISLTSSAVHADLILPIKTDVFDWRTIIPDHKFSGDTTGLTHLAVGWGDQGFFIETPTWNDLKVSTAANALLIPSDTCLHFIYFNGIQIPLEARSVTISNAQYAELVQFILDSFETDSPSTQDPIPNASYAGNDLFFAARGTYHCMNTCNSWVGRGMGKAGVRVGWFTPMPKSVFLYLPLPENDSPAQ